MYNGHAMPRGQCSTTLLSVLSLLHSYFLLFHDIQYALDVENPRQLMQIVHAELPTVTYSLPFDQLRVFIVTTTHCKRQFFWSKSTVTLIYEHKYLEYNLTGVSISLGPMTSQTCAFGQVYNTRCESPAIGNLIKCDRKAVDHSLGRLVTIVPVGTSCLASHQCNTQGPQLSKTLDNSHPAACTAPSGTVGFGQQGVSFQFSPSLISLHLVTKA